MSSRQQGDDPEEDDDVELLHPYDLHEEANDQRRVRRLSPNFQVDSDDDDLLCSRLTSMGAWIREMRGTRKLEGSLARDHLANERTFLAWFRTSLTVVGLGVALVKLQMLQGFALVSILLGAFMLLYASYRYYHVLYMVNRGFFSPGFVGIAALVLFALVAVIAAMIFALSHA